MGETFFRKPDLQINLDFILFNIRFSGNTAEVWRVILGVGFVVIVLLIPHGIVGQINLLWIQMRRWGRKYIYDRIIRGRPELARLMQPLTGESPEVAVALAETTRDASLLQWLIRYPWAVAYSVVMAVALMGGLLAWETHAGFSLFLLGTLIVSPIVIPLWMRQNYQKLLDNASHWMSFLQRLSRS